MNQVNYIVVTAVQNNNHLMVILPMNRVLKRKRSKFEGPESHRRWSYGGME